MRNHDRKSNLPAVVLVLVILLLLGGGIGGYFWRIARYEAAQQREAIEALKRQEAMAAERIRRAEQQALAEMEAARVITEQDRP